MCSTKPQKEKVFPIATALTAMILLMRNANIREFQLPDDFAKNFAHEIFLLSRPYYVKFRAESNDTTCVRANM